MAFASARGPSAGGFSAGAGQALSIRRHITQPTGLIQGRFQRDRARPAHFIASARRADLGQRRSARAAAGAASSSDSPATVPPACQREPRASALGRKHGYGASCGGTGARDRSRALTSHMLAALVAPLASPMDSCRVKHEPRLTLPPPRRHPRPSPHDPVDGTRPDRAARDVLARKAGAPKCSASARERQGLRRVSRRGMQWNAVQRGDADTSCVTRSATRSTGAAKRHARKRRVHIHRLLRSHLLARRVHDA